MRWLLILTIAKLALFLILASALHVGPFVGANASQYFIPIGQRIASTGHFNGIDSRDDSSVPPGYPFFLALLDLVSERGSLWVAVILQMLADLVVAIMLLALGRTLGDSTAGGAAAVLWLLFPPAVLISTWISPESLFTMFLIASLALLVIPGGNVGMRAALAGLAFGIATLFRANTLLLPFILVPFWIWKRAYRTGICFSMVVALSVGMWTLRNYLVLRDPIMVSASFGSAFMQGSDERFYQGKSTEYPGFMVAAAEAGIVKPAVETGSNINRWSFRLGIWSYQQQFEKNGALSVLGMIGRKLIKMWYLTEGGNVRAEVLLGLCSLLVAPLGLVELWTWWKSGNFAGQLLSITVAYWILIHILVVPIARYMVPILPILMLGACMRLHGVLPAGARSSPGI